MKNVGRVSRRYKTKPVPFAISRQIKISLVDQTVEGFRQAIRTGYYQSGDILPPYESIARQLGVSARVPIAAAKLLASESLICPRPRVGCEVLSRKATCWQGEVLVLIPTPCQASFYAATLIGEVRRRLTLAGYLVETLSVDSVNGRLDLGVLDEVLKRPIAFAVSVYMSDVAINRLVRANVPFLDVSDRDRRPSAIRPVRTSISDALSQFRERCRALRVKSVLLVECFGYPEIAVALRKDGLKVEHVRIFDSFPSRSLEALRRDAIEFVNSRFGDGCQRPDVILFTDDIIAQSALLALSCKGIRVPQDQKVAVFSNADSGPVFVRPLTCFRFDPAAHGQSIATAALRHLNGDRDASPVLLEAIYREGETF